jgi:hypothetical protein
VGRERPGTGSPPPPTADPTGPASAGGAEATAAGEAEAALAEMRDRLAATPAEVVVANHAYGLFELAALHLSLERPQLDQARLAIDALAALVEGLGDRLGPAAQGLRDGLAQLRLAWVQIQAGLAGGGGPSTG